jgi:purine-nucleoside/S-methyl-5'-thioadenosine phosphorylase / adenosine deaminase
VFARSGGVSTGCFDSLNLGLSVGDDPGAVAENRRRILAKMESPQAVYLNQVHGDTIHVLTEERQEPIIADGVVTDRPGVCLVIQVADCQGVLLYDPERQVIAGVHSGWRGSVQNIIGNCIDVMTRSFNCNPRAIRAGISPSLGPCCAQFIHYKEEIPEVLWRYKLPGKPYFDFWTLSCDQIMAKGVKQENIEVLNICTQCNTDLFYSYRGEKRSGRFGCAILLKE